MLKKTLITLGLLAATTLTGCVVVPARPVIYGPEIYAPPVFFSPFFIGGGYGRGYGYGGGYRHGYYR